MNTKRDLARRVKVLREPPAGMISYKGTILQPETQEEFRPLFFAERTLPPSVPVLSPVEGLPLQLAAMSNGLRE